MAAHGTGAPASRSKEKEEGVSTNYQSGDVWSRAVTRNGFAVDELRSVLQKSIRRGLVEEAALTAYELFANGPETEEMLWRRLEIIASEDVGAGLLIAPAIIEALYAQARRMLDRGDRWIYCAHAVRLLASAPKDSMSMELAGWARAVVERGERMPLVEDYMLDLHTRRGVEMGRDAAHWWNEGARLSNRIPGYDPKWGDYLRALAGAESWKEDPRWLAVSSK
jgi:replication-associated recombination protein RarA